MEGRLRNPWTELPLIVSIGELEERQGSAITETEEAVTVRTHLSEQLVGFAPGRHERQSYHVFVEFTGLLHVVGCISRVMQAARQIRGSWHPADSPISRETS
jgi:hypothetical protein